MSVPLDLDTAPLTVPPLETMRAALARGLADTYEAVSVEVVRCPDLRDIGCAWPGLGGDERIVDVGGEPYAHNPRYRDVRFAVDDVVSRTGAEGGRVLGAGMACPAALDGHCGEVIANTDIAGESRSRVAMVGEQGECVVRDYHAGLFAGLANLFVSRGETGSVLSVEVARRHGEQGSLPQAMRAALAPLVEDRRDAVALGGVFQVLEGQIRAHVMPDYDCIPHPYYDTTEERVTRDFLRFYEPLGPGLLCFSVLWTGDPTGGRLDLRESGEHTHFYHPGDRGQGGHYHHDVTPETIRCRGWFAPARQVHRVGNIYRRLREGAPA